MERTTTTAHDYRTGELDLLAVLECVVARRPRVLKNGLPNLTFFRTANESLAHPDDEAQSGGFTQVEFWLALASELELLATDDRTLVPGPYTDEFFALPEPERRERLQSAWLDSVRLNEFALTRELELPALAKGRTVDVGTDIPGPDVLREARRALVAGLDAETTLTALLRHLEGTHRNLFINHDEDGSWRNVFYRGIRIAGEREDAERDGNWEHVEGAVVRMMLELPLTCLGFVEYDPRTRNIRPAAYEPVSPDFEVVVQPNFEALVLGDRPDTSTLWRLARFSTPVREDRVRRYVLERKPFAEALGRGHEVDELVDWLAGLSRMPLPQNVVFSLREWGEMSDRIKIWPDALFIEAEGVEDLTRLLPAAIAERFAPRVVGGRHYVCPAPPHAELKPLLPPRRAVLDYSRRLPPVIEPGEGVTLRAPRELLHLRARQVLALVSDSRSTDVYELRSERVRESAEALGVAELMHRLRTALSRPLSAPVALALRTWSGEFAAPYIGQTEILVAEHPDQAALIEELPDVQRWVQKRLAKGVYMLKPGGSAPVRKALTGRE